MRSCFSTMMGKILIENLSNQYCQPMEDLNGLESNVRTCTYVFVHASLQWTDVFLDPD